MGVRFATRSRAIGAAVTLLCLITACQEPSKPPTTTSVPAAQPVATVPDSTTISAPPGPVPGTRITEAYARMLARDAYFGLVSEVAHVNALRQGLDSSQTALKATEAGYEVGTRTAVEVLVSRQALVQAQTSYAQARYTYILDLIQLRLASGNPGLTSR